MNTKSYNSLGVVFKDEDDLMARAKKLEGLKFSEISEIIGQLDETHRKHTKGVATKVIETEYFGIPSNSSEAPDIENLGNALVCVVVGRIAKSLSG